MIKRNQFLKILTLHFEPSTKKIFKLNMANYILKSWKNPQFNAAWFTTPAPLFKNPQKRHRQTRILQRKNVRITNFV